MPVKILIADDNVDLLEHVGLAFALEGYEVRTVSDGAAAIAQARSDPPDLIILDLMMPRMTGFEACHELRLDPTTQAIPIIAWSSKKLKNCKDLGFDDWLEKPCDPPELFSLVKDVLKRAANRRQTVGAHASVTDFQGGYARNETADSANNSEVTPTEILPLLRDFRVEVWGETFSSLLKSEHTISRGLAVIALAAWQKQEDAPFRLRQGQQFLWSHIRHTLVGNLSDAAVRWATIAPVALALLQFDMTTELQKCLMLDEPECRQWALLILRQENSSIALQAAERAVVDHNSDVRGAAATILTSLGTERHIPLLMRLLADEEAGVREQSTAALIRIGGEMATDALITALESGNADTAEAIPHALAQIANEHCIEALLNAARTRPEPNVLRQVAFALSTFMHNEQCRSMLEQLVKHDAPIVKETAARLLAGRS